VYDEAERKNIVAIFVVYSILLPQVSFFQEMRLTRVLK
jgi:hypothetical protein